MRNNSIIDKYIPIIDYYFRRRDKRMKVFYCAQCGTRLNVALKAVKGHGIVRIVEHHECLDEPVEFDLSPVEQPAYVPEIGEKNKFVQKLNSLHPTAENGPMPEMKDRRPSDQVKSNAPMGVLDQIKGIQNSNVLIDPDFRPDTDEEEVE